MYGEHWTRRSNAKIKHVHRLLEIYWIRIEMLPSPLAISSVRHHRHSMVAIAWVLLELDSPGSNAKMRMSYACGTTNQFYSRTIPGCALEYFRFNLMALFLLRSHSANFGWKTFVHSQRANMYTLNDNRYMGIIEKWDEKRMIKSNK